MNGKLNDYFLGILVVKIYVLAIGRLYPPPNLRFFPFVHS